MNALNSIYAMYFEYKWYDVESEITVFGVNIKNILTLRSKGVLVQKMQNYSSLKYSKEHA